MRFSPLAPRDRLMPLKVADMPFRESAYMWTFWCPARCTHTHTSVLQRKVQRTEKNLMCQVGEQSRVEVQEPWRHLLDQCSHRAAFWGPLSTSQSPFAEPVLTEQGRRGPRAADSLSEQLYSRKDGIKAQTVRCS